MNDCVKMKRDFIELIHKNEGILQRICNMGILTKKIITRKF